MAGGGRGIRILLSSLLGLTLLALRSECSDRSSPSKSVLPSLRIPPPSAAFSDSARFERWSHFKDYGVPGTVHDPVNKAMIADGSCRLLGQGEGYLLWHDEGRTQRVVNQLKAAPPTSNPSNFTLTLKELLAPACFGSLQRTDPTTVTPAYNLTVMAGSLQNWYRALCAPEGDAAWKGLYDPAYQPQQMALTSGFMCILACDLNARKAPDLGIFADSPEKPQEVRNEVCATFPWKTEPETGQEPSRGRTDFTKARTPKDLAAATEPLLTNGPCVCPSGGEGEEQTLPFLAV